MARKRTISVILDDDLVAVLESADEALSTQINEAVRVEVERRGRLMLLTEWLAEIEASDGPVDEELVETFEQLLR